MLLLKQVPHLYLIVCFFLLPTFLDWLWALIDGNNFLLFLYVAASMVPGT